MPGLRGVLDIAEGTSGHPVEESAPSGTTSRTMRRSTTCFAETWLERRPLGRRRRARSSDLNHQQIAAERHSHPVAA